MPRLRDQVRIEVVGAGGSNGTLDNFTSFKIVNDITAPAEASFEVGEDGSYEALGALTIPGAQYRVFVNGLLRLTGRVETRDIPQDPGGGSVMRFVVKTRMSDAHFASARQGTRVKGVSVKDFVLDLYSQLGFEESDFVFDPSTARDLMTGRISRGKGYPRRVDLERIKVPEARVRPPESIYQAADRHLRRHGLMHWDAPDGRIVVSAPNDTQDPAYYFRSLRGLGATNNVLDINRVQDWSGIPSWLGVYGVGGGKRFSRARVAGFDFDEDVLEAGFHRPVTILAEQIKKQTLADRAAEREMAARKKRKDAFDVTIDGLSWWDGDSRTPFGIDTVADIRSDSAGGVLGAYYVHRVELSLDAGAGATAKLTTVRAGIWNLGTITGSAEKKMRRRRPASPGPTNTNFRKARNLRDPLEEQ